MTTKPKPSNGLMFHALRTETLIARLRRTIEPFRQLSPKIVTALGPTGIDTMGIHDAGMSPEKCLRLAYCMLVDVQWFLSEYDDPDNQVEEENEEDDTTTPNPEEDEDECE
jgi:hypothetical protein